MRTRSSQAWKEVTAAGIWAVGVKRTDEEKWADSLASGSGINGKAYTTGAALRGEALRGLGTSVPQELCRHKGTGTCNRRESDAL